MLHNARVMLAMSAHVGPMNLAIGGVQDDIKDSKLVSKHVSNQLFKINHLQSGPDITNYGLKRQNVCSGCNVTEIGEIGTNYNNE